MAVGDLLVELEALAGITPAVNYPLLSLRGSTWTLGFNDSADDSVVFEFTMPSSYAGGNITVTADVLTASDVTITNVMDFDFVFKKLTATTGRDNVDFVTGTTTLNATGNVTAVTDQPTTLTVQFLPSQIDGIVAGDRLQFRCKVDSVASNYVGDAEVVNIKLTES